MTGDTACLPAAAEGGRGGRGVARTGAGVRGGRGGATKLPSWSPVHWGSSVMLLELAPSSPLKVLMIKIVQCTYVYCVVK